MTWLIENNKIQFVAVAGDPIHEMGVKSTDDPEWKFKVEDIFTGRALHSIPWYAVPGNHEYKGNPQAVVDYSTVSDRWAAPARYYTLDKKVKKSHTRVHFTFLDTTPLIDARKATFQPGAVDEEYEQRELAWFDEQMSHSNAKWNIVIGHMPVYADTYKDPKERAQMQEKINPTLVKYGVDVYVCGHLHSFQHILRDDSPVNYIVNSSAGTSREVSAIEGTKFCADAPGFTLFSIGEDTIDFYFISPSGEILYSNTITKK